MSEYFETQLREGSAQVAGSLDRRPADALREYSERRARRVRAGAAAVTASAVLLVAGAVFSLEGKGGGAADVTAAAPASVGVSSSRSAGTGSVPDPSRYVAGAWLDESRLPYAGTIAWQVNPQVLGAKLGGAVQLVLPDDTVFFGSTVGNFDTYCSIPALVDGAVADQVASFDGAISGSSLPSTPGIPASVTQNTVFYRNQSDASAAWGGVGSGFEACARFETGGVSGETKTYPSIGRAQRILNKPDVQCWTNLTAVTGLGSGGGTQDLLDDVCFVRHGTLIGNVALRFDGPPALSGVDFSTVNATTVSDLEQALSAYGSS